jgi:4'-phosphopantetheinyl transferase
MPGIHRRGVGGHAATESPKIHKRNASVVARYQSPDIIRVWFAHTRDCCDGSDQRLLTPAEYDAAQRFRFERDRRLFLLSHRMARTVIANELKIQPSDVRFRKTKFGKPELPDDTGCSLQFNCAHSGNWVALALAYGRRVGVDIEQERADLDLMELARHSFSSREIANLQSDVRDRARLFFKYWTMKEAYLKAEGSGLSIRLNALDASSVPDEPSRPVLPVEHTPRGIYIQRLLAPQGYAAAVAADGSEWNSEVIPWTGVCKASEHV